VIISRSGSKAVELRLEETLTRQTD